MDKSEMYRRPWVTSDKR